MLVHMGGNSDTGLIGDGVGPIHSVSVTIPRLFAHLWPSKLFNGMKVLNHYGWADPGQHAWDDWLQVDTRDDTGPYTPPARPMNTVTNTGYLVLIKSNRTR